MRIYLNKNRVFWAFCLALLLLPVCSSLLAIRAFAETATASSPPEGMTLWQIIKAGGIFMIILAAISMAALAITIDNFLYLNPGKLAPGHLAESVIELLERKQLKAVDDICLGQDNIITRIVKAGLERRSRGDYLAKEAMDNIARKEIGMLWQRIGILSDIAAIAPMIGLLGTVVGMIQAFNTIAFQTAVVKPILLAGGIGKAMITTAGGLVVAIPAMLAYSYFRIKVQNIMHTVENYSTDIIKLITDLSHKKPPSGQNAV